MVINDRNYRQYIHPIVDGEVKMHGLIPRDYGQYPLGYLSCAKPFDIPLIPESEWQSRLDAQIAAKAQLSDIRNRGMAGSPIPSRDQNGKGYCWAHSGVSAHLLVRALNNLPYADLSAYAIACKIKQFQDQGGWGSEGVEFQGSQGCPTSANWPQQSMDRKCDNPTTWAEAATHKYTEWMDGEPKNKAQLVTALLLNLPGILDFDWWSHSVCGMDLVSLDPFRIRIWNSWGDSWSENGSGILEGSKAIPDGMLFARVVMAS